MKAASNVAVLVGGLSRHCASRRIADLLAQLAPRSLRLELVDISHLSLYENHCQQQPAPAGWRLFRQQIRAADGVLMVAPECRRRVPGVLRNALRIAADPNGAGAWEGKPGAVICVPDDRVESGADYRLRQALLLLNVPVMRPPEMDVTRRRAIGLPARVDDSAALAFLREYIARFERWVHIAARH